MALPVSAYLDRSAFLNGGYFDSLGRYPSCKPPNVTGYRRASYYYDRLDCIVQRENQSVHGNRYAVRLDANYLDNSSVSCKWAAPGALGAVNSVATGEWDMQAATQKFYFNSTGNTWHELDVDNMADAGTIYPSTVGVTSGLNGKSYPTDYAWTCPNSGMVFFETMDYALVAMARSKIPGGGVALDSWRPILVSISTGDAIENVPIITKYTTTPNDGAEGPPYIGETFELSMVQFVPDDDSTPANPKGYLLFVQHDMGLSDDTWLKQVDWNPNGVDPTEGNPARTHCQTRVFSRFKPTQAAWPGGCPVANSIYEHPIVRRSDDTWLCVWGNDLEGPHSPGDCGTMVIGKQATPTLVTRPVAIGRPKTNSIATFVSTVLGSLGERISGVSLGWTHQRASEYREVLPTTGTPGESVTVDHPPIDDTAPMEMYHNDSLLTEETHWSLTQGAGDPDTGVVQFLSPHTMAGVYEFRYRHVETPVDGAHGSLLTPSAKSDDDGNLYARIRYEDDDTKIGMWDNLSGETED